MATFNKFNSFVSDLAEKVHNLGADTLRVAEVQATVFTTRADECLPECILQAVHPTRAISLLGQI